MIVPVARSCLSHLAELPIYSHSLYKWEADKRRAATRPRAASFAGSTASARHPAFEHIHEPGGFRRNYVLLRAEEQGVEQPPMARNFIEFLYLFGHFVSMHCHVLRVCAPVLSIIFRLVKI